MLTDQTIKAMQPPEKGYRIEWDGKLKGFGCRISQAGTRSFVVLIASGRPKTIGRYPLLSLADARREARELLAQKTLGKIHPARTPFAEAVDAFLTDSGTRIRPRTLKDYTRLLQHLQFGRTAIADITSRDILNQLKPLTPYERHHTFCIATTFFRWCMHQHFIDRSPTDTMAVPYNKRPRERVLSGEEIACLWKATECPRTSFNTIVRLLLLTGQRRGEIAVLQWDWIDKQECTITFPSTVTKNKRTHTFPYGSLVAHILAEIPRFIDCPYLFPAARQRSGTTTVFNGFSKAKVALDKASGVTGYTIHDIRRSFATGMQQLGARIEVTERLLNHVSGTQSGITGVYQRYHWMPEMQAAVLNYESYLAKLIAPKGLSLWGCPDTPQWSDPDAIS